MRRQGVKTKTTFRDGLKGAKESRTKGRNIFVIRGGTDKERSAQIRDVLKADGSREKTMDADVHTLTQETKTAHVYDRSTDVSIIDASKLGNLDTKAGQTAAASDIIHEGIGHPALGSGHSDSGIMTENIETKAKESDVKFTPEQAGEVMEWARDIKF